MHDAITLAENVGNAWQMSSLPTGYAKPALAYLPTGPAVAYCSSATLQVGYAVRAAGGAWDLTPINDAYVLSNTLALAISPEGDPAIAYGTFIYEGAIGVRYSTRVNGDWVAETAESVANFGDAINPGDLRFGPDGQPVLSYCAFRGSPVDDAYVGWTRRSGVNQWSGSQTLTAWAQLNLSAPGLALYASGDVAMSFVQADVLYYSPPTRVVDAAPSWPSKIAIDSRGDPVIAYSGAGQPLKYARRENGVWQSTIVDAMTARKPGFRDQSGQ